MKLFWRLPRLGGITVSGVLLAGLLFAGCATSEEPLFTSTPAVVATPTQPPPAVTPSVVEEKGASPATAVSAPTPAVATPHVATANSAPLGIDGMLSDRFAVGDQVIVDFSGSIETLKPHEERIKEDGTITLPLINSVKAAGKTPGELQVEIQRLYVPKYYVRLTVTVKSQERAYYVGGEVRSPNRYAYTGAITVTKAIQSAGDFNDFANKKKVQLTRANGTTITVDCKKAIVNAKLDPAVYPGDRIHVPRRFW